MSEDLIRRSDAIKALDANFTIKGKENMQTVLNYLELVRTRIEGAPSIDIVRCEKCRKSHIDGKTTHYLWCTEWGRSTDVFGYCERGEREGE